MDGPENSPDIEPVQETTYPVGLRRLFFLIWQKAYGLRTKQNWMH